MIATAIDPSRLNNPHEVPQMFEWMTEQEWMRRYPDEWVLVIDPDWDEHKGLQSGFVAYHSDNPDTTYSEAMRLKPKYCSVPYTGNEPEGMTYVL